MVSSPVTHVRHVAHAVPDFDSALDFYRGVWGLRTVATDGDLAFLAAEGSTEAFSLRLRRAPDKHLDLLSFGVVDRAAVDRLGEELAAAGVRIDRGPGPLDTPGGGYGMRFFDPDGRLVEVSADVTPRAARVLEAQESIPTGLSHVVINSPHIETTLAFYKKHLGFEVSDWLGDFMVFLRVGPQHHVLAITRAPHTSFNHVAWDTRGLDEYLRATGRLVRSGTPPVWGPGRHGPGNNTFSYFVDPTGNVTEYTSELQLIPDDERWVAGVHPAGQDESDQWGTAGLMSEFIPYALGQPDPHLWTPSPV